MFPLIYMQRQHTRQWRPSGPAKLNNNNCGACRAPCHEQSTDRLDVDGGGANVQSLCSSWPSELAIRDEPVDGEGAAHLLAVAQQVHLLEHTNIIRVGQSSCPLAVAIANYYNRGDDENNERERERRNDSDQ